MALCFAVLQKKESCPISIILCLKKAKNVCDLAEI